MIDLFTNCSLFYHWSRIVEMFSRRNPPNVFKLQFLEPHTFKSGDQWIRQSLWKPGVGRLLRLKLNKLHILVDLKGGTVILKDIEIMVFGHWEIWFSQIKMRTRKNCQLSVIWWPMTLQTEGLPAFPSWSLVQNRFKHIYNSHNHGIKPGNLN